MAVTLIGAQGLFTRLGKIINLINQINTFRSTTLTTEVDDITDEYGDDRQDLVDGLFTQAASNRAANDAFLEDLRQLAEDTVIQMVYDDAKINPQTLTVALTELIRQMEATADDVDASTVSATLAYTAGNNGDGKGGISVISPKGTALENVFDETVTLLVTADSQTGGTTEGQEEFTIDGDAAVNGLEPEWPDGSGATGTLTVISAQEDAVSNLLTNSDFETFTVANTPDQWDLDTGVAGTDIFSAGTPNHYIGTTALRFLGNGAQLTRISQIFDDSGNGTAGELLPNTVYGVNVVTKVSGVPAAGVLRLSLQTTGDAIINDDEGTANSYTISLPGETTTYAHHYGTFRTPKALSAGTQFVIELTTALSAGVSVYIDEAAIAPATQLYPGGPYVTMFQGAAKWVTGDRVTATVVNDYAGEFQSAFERMFEMRAKNLILPSDTGATETVADSLIS